MALLLMLICVTLSSVILAATTASAGRQSQLRETDQSYYNVTSAAGLFWDEIQGGKTVAVERTCVARNNGSGWQADEGSGACSIDGTYGTSSSLNGTVAASLFQVATCDAAFGTSGTLQDVRNLDSADVIGSLDLSTLSTNPLQAFGPYELTVDTWTAGGKVMSPVVVTITGSQDGLVTMRFEEKTNPSCICIITAALGSGSSAPTYVESADGSYRTFTWENDYEWVPLSISMREDQ